MKSPALPRLPRVGLWSRMGLWERVSAGLAAISLLVVTRLPLWRIWLTSGQYPEGLRIDISAHEVSGDLQNVNILNHYIGMAPLDSSTFAEFHWMGPVLVGFAALALIVSLWGRRGIALLTWLTFLAFGLAMTVDMHHWLWTWGHHLDPMAPIRVPGFMPPLIGFKQIANFGVWSLPTWGGWLLILTAALGPLSVWLDLRSRP